MMNGLAFMPGALPRPWPAKFHNRGKSRLVPTRSMVGQLPLEQHIGVRIPGGQPNSLLQSPAPSSFLDVSLLSSTLLVKLNQWFTAEPTPENYPLMVYLPRLSHLPTTPLLWSYSNA